VNVVMNPRVPQNAGNFLISKELVSFSRRTLLHGVSKWDIYLNIMMGTVLSVLTT
jgi:hypothetical protein